MPKRTDRPPLHGATDVRGYVQADNAADEQTEPANDNQLPQPRSHRARAICAITSRAYNSNIAKKITLKEIGDMLTHVVKHMATKDDIADLKIELKSDVARVAEQVNSIETELKYGRYESRLGKLEDKVFGAPRR